MIPTAEITVSNSCVVVPLASSRCATTLPGQADDTVNQRELIASAERLKELEALQRSLAGAELRTTPQNEVQETRPGNDPKSQRALEIKRLQAQISDNIKTYNDHRIVMAGCVASLLCAEGQVFDDVKAIEKSYPGFVADFLHLTQA